MGLDSRPTILTLLFQRVVSTPPVFFGFPTWCATNKLHLPSLVVFSAEAVARSFVPMELGRSVVLRDRCRRMRCQGVLGAWPRGARVGMGCPIGRFPDFRDGMNGELGSMGYFTNT